MWAKLQIPTETPHTPLSLVKIKLSTVSPQVLLTWVAITGLSQRAQLIMMAWVGKQAPFLFFKEIIQESIAAVGRGRAGDAKVMGARNAGGLRSGAPGRPCALWEQNLHAGCEEILPDMVGSSSGKVQQWYHSQTACDFIRVDKQEKGWGQRMHKLSEVREQSGLPGRSGC